jgi:sigma-B regulation protein RsbU (phosphoserine phosphatase)
MNAPSPEAPREPATGESLDTAILRLLMDTIPDRIYFKDQQSRFIRVNASYAHWHGAASPEVFVGRNDFDLFSPEHAARALAEEQHIIRTGVPIIGEVQQITKQDGTRTWGSTTKMPWRDAAGRIIGTFGVTRDVTAAKEAEEKLEQERNLLQTIIDHLPARIFVKDALSRFLLNNRAHLQWLGAESQEDARGKTTTDFYQGERGRQAMADDHQVIETGTPIVAQEKSDFGPAGRTRWSLTTKVPLRDLTGRITGLVGISQDITDRKRTEQELETRSAEMEADLKMARQIQETFFPRSYPVFPAGVAPERSRLRFAHRYLPAATLGGDFFDIVRLSDEKCGVLICDVMGHGVRAGLLTALIRGRMEEMGERAADPAHVIGEINAGLIPIVEQTGQPIFATAFYGVADLASGTLSYANAGHPAPFFLPGSGAPSVHLALPDPEPAAGLVPAFAYSRHERTFLTGDCLLAYTDGIFEATDAQGRMFGEERLAPIAEQARSAAFQAMLDSLIFGVESFTGRQEFEDDICLLAVWRPT